jgi:acid phosphatase
MALLSAAAPASAADTFDGKYLSIPTATIGNATYSNMVVTVGRIVSGPVGSSPDAGEDSYDAASNQLTIPAVTFGGTTYFNVVVTVGALVSIGAVTGTDSFDGTDLHIVSVLDGTVSYAGVVISVGQLIGVGGGMPAYTQDQYQAASNQLLVPVVVDAVDGRIYTNVTITAGRIVSGPVGAGPFGHIALVVLENSNYSSVVGSTSMPYLNSLIADYGLATQYYADTHPSIGNYEMLAVGQVLTNDDNQTPATFPISADNAVRELVAAGKTWRAYAESIPSAGYIGGNSGNYYVRHVPMPYLTDVQDSVTGRAGLVPFTQLATDIADGQLPDYSFITPNACDDAHNCALGVADTWLSTNIAPLLASAPFRDDGLLIIVFDESGNDNTHGGGRVCAVLASPAFSKRGYQSTTLYQHESTLRLMLKGLGVATLPGAAATAPDMWEFFTFPPP